MPASHAAAVAAAAQAADDLRQHFADLGSTEHPNGTIWRAYRLARQALGARFTLAALRDVITQLQATIQTTSDTLLQTAAAQGAATAQVQLAAYGDTASLPALDGVVRDAQLAVDLGIAAQLTSIVALYGVTQDPALIVGDGTRVGALTPAVCTALLARWLTTTHQGAFLATVRQAARRGGYQRQAIATLSARTTDCCLRVHGQIVDRDEPFRLVGTPRFADDLLNPPFHHYCRTTVALVPAGQGEDDLTAAMQAGARRELQARNQGGTTQQSRSGSAVAP